MTQCGYCTPRAARRPGESHGICAACQQTLDDQLADRRSRRTVRSPDDADVRDDAGRIVAGPQPAYPPRPIGPWNLNEDAREGASGR